MMYTVRRGDTLTAIAARVYHNPRDWPWLWWTSRRIVTDPNMITVGERLKLSSRHPDPPAWLVTAAAAAVPRPAPVVITVSSNAGTVTAQTTPAAIPASAAMYSYTALEQLWVSAGGPSWAEASAATIAECESGGNPDAYNVSSGATGLWQILGQVVGGDLRNAFTNALNAVSKFRASGDTFAQWVCQA
jgi:hypothetical protein